MQLLELRFQPGKSSLSSFSPQAIREDILLLDPRVKARGGGD